MRSRPLTVDGAIRVAAPAWAPRSLRAGAWSAWLGAVAVPAWGQECPALPEQASAALSAYDEGNVDEAKKAVAVGYASLTCQTEVVPTAVLLELYRVHALVSLTLGDQAARDYATIRAVAAQHEGGRPSDDFGPKLQAEYDAWAERLVRNLVTVQVIDDGIAYVDGREVDRARPLEIVHGEHLVQLPRDGGMTSKIAEITADFQITTGIGVPVIPVPMPLPEPLLPEPVRPVVTRTRSVPLVVSTVATAGLAGFALATAYRSERLFKTSPYLADEFGTCHRGEECWPGARSSAIQADATRIDIAYGIGYGLSAISSGLLVITVVGVPHRER